MGADHGIGVPQGVPPVYVGEDQLDRPTTPDEARAAVRAAVTRKTDAIKLWLDDFQGQKLVKMKPEIYKAVIEEAHLHNLKVFAHIYYLQDAKDLIRAGVDILGHGVRDKQVEKEFIDLLKQHNTVYIPTLGVDESFYLFALHPELLNAPEVKEALNPEQQKGSRNNSTARHLKRGKLDLRPTGRIPKLCFVAGRKWVLVLTQGQSQCVFPVMQSAGNWNCWLRRV
ncbi:hypothetical protein SAMN05192562_1078 [Kosakonia arachidis]|uniref:Amidohydrolase family protein n=1 Tax=Kosakonia arachidis TaxID=551989 RepID=A0A1I7DUW9_9ENTR|nr:hypothetical protein [Kosakonia arachidis]SFU15459.1 hypothetical protein SAMN05192562_1078 [Kosakonia arachidis]